MTEHSAAIEAAEAVIMRCQHMCECECMEEAVAAAWPHLIREAVEAIGFTDVRGTRWVRIQGAAHCLVTEAALLAALCPEVP